MQFVMYVSGIGRTKFGILRDSLAELAYTAMYRCIEDSGLDITDVDAIFLSNFLGGPLERQLHLNALMSSLLPGINIPIIRIETACASGGSAFQQALLSLSAYEHVMVVGVEKMTAATNEENTLSLSMASDRMLDQKHGLIFPASYALIAQQHMLRYGTTHEDLERISLKNHANAQLNSLAHFHYKRVTASDVRDAPMIASPLTLFDCSPISDGAVAVILSRERFSDRDIRLAGTGMATDTLSISERKDLTSFAATRIAAKAAYAQAGISPRDISLAEVHDCFTIAELVAMEDLGFCPVGEGKELVRKGTTQLDGDLPVNTDGGLKADGHPIGASGLAQIFEVVTQLRGEAGKRQVTDAAIGLTHSVGGVGGTAVVNVFGAR